MDYSKEKENSPAAPVEVPIEILSEDALSGIIKEFVMREGTDYGREEVSLEKKIEQIRRQMSHGDIKIVFDPSSESVTLMTQRQWQAACRAGLGVDGR
jgi:uncharacterized protein YheU (UPF0270 family)